MLIKGFQKISLLDFPGKVSAIVFTPGCNFRCPFCYNRDLVLGGEHLPIIPEAEVFAYLRKRKKLLDGVVITGGEPLLQADLGGFLSRCQRMGFAIKLDTNGSLTTALCSVVVRGLVNYVALDVKTSFGRYSQVTGCKIQDSKCEIEESIRLIIDSGVEYELRTTVVPGLHKREDLVDLAKQLKELTKQPKNQTTKKPVRWYLQQFQPKNCLNPEFERRKPYSKAELEEFLPAVEEYMPGVELRGV